MVADKKRAGCREFARTASSHPPRNRNFHDIGWRDSVVRFTVVAAQNMLSLSSDVKEAPSPSPLPTPLANSPLLLRPRSDRPYRSTFIFLHPQFGFPHVNSSILDEGLLTGPTGLPSSFFVTKLYPLSVAFVALMRRRVDDNECNVPYMDRKTQELSIWMSKYNSYIHSFIMDEGLMTPQTSTRLLLLGYGNTQLL